MTTTLDAGLTTPVTTAATDSGPRTPSRAVRVRRGFLVASPVLAGVLAVVGAYADPGAGISGRHMLEIYADNPGPLQFKSLGFHWAYAFWIAPALMVAPYVRGRGAWLANIAALLGFAGMTTLPGMLLSDWFDSAVGQLYGVSGAVAVDDRIQSTMWGLKAMAAPGMVGFMLALPLATVALWRAGLVRWWAFAAVVAGYAAFMLSNVMWWGCAITTVAFTVLAVALARATR